METVNIPSRLHSVAQGNVVAGANEILDDDNGMKQSVINNELIEASELFNKRIGDKSSSTGTSGTYPYNGMGRVYLPKNMINGVNTLTQDMFYKGNVGSRVPNTNTIFVIQYDYVLAEDITIPENCVLEFDGGSLNGEHTITGNNTRIQAELVKIFSDTIILGSWNVDRIYSNWVDNNTNGLRNLINLSSDYINNIIYLEGGNYVGVVDTIKNSLIELKSNTTLVINATIELQTNGLDSYSIISVGGKKNVSIIGSGIIIGDADTHTVEGEGFCNGITIWESENVKIEGLTIQKCFTDCIYVGGDNIPSKNIRINDCQLKESRRQGISICNCVIFDISNCFISDILGAEPERCIDIEPNTNCICKSGIIYNNRFDSKNGLSCNGTKGIADGIFIKNNIFNNVEYSLNNVLSNNIYIDKNIIYSGNIVISSGTNINVSNNTINAQTIQLDATCSIENNKITVSQFNCFSNNTGLKDNDIHGDISFGTSDITISANVIRNNIIRGDLFVNSSDGEIYNNIFYGKNDIRKANSIHNNQFIYFTRRENDSCLTVVNAKCIADNLFNVFENASSQDAQSLYTFITITASAFATILSGNTFIKQDAQLSPYFCVISLSSNTNKIFAYDNICSEEDKTYGDSSKIFGTIVRYKNRGAVSELPSLPNTALGNIYWDKDNNKPLFKTNAGWVDATGQIV